MRAVWPTLHVLVIGDVMLDKYIWGEVKRISPEAPIPIVCSSRQTAQPGGAANVAMNAAALGAFVSLAGFVGKDEDGAVLATHLTAGGIAHHLTVLETQPTTAKTRILGGQQQMLRVDVEFKGVAPACRYQELLHNVASVFAAESAEGPGPVSVVVLSDYAKSVLSPEVCGTVIAQARRLGIPVIVDPKGRGYSRYRGATTLCPNLAELGLESGLAADNEEAVLCAGESMLPGLECQSLTVTLSERGIIVLDGKTRRHAPAVARQVFDVSGAGDTVTAVLALCHASQMPSADSLRLANLAAGIVVAKVGTAPVEIVELLAALGAAETAMDDLEASSPTQAPAKVASLKAMSLKVAAWRSAGETVVFTNGCFDLLHAGHVRLLEAARKMGSHLVVGLNSDASVRQLKGPLRPIVAESDRATMLAGLSVVDGIVLFDEVTPLQCILTLRPDVLIKGGDYASEVIVGSAELPQWGGKVMLVPMHGEASTTAMIAAVIESSAKPTSTATIPTSPGSDTQHSKMLCDIRSAAGYTEVITG